MHEVSSRPHHLSLDSVMSIRRYVFTLLVRFKSDIMTVHQDESLQAFYAHGSTPKKIHDTFMFNEFDWRKEQTRNIRRFHSFLEQLLRMRALDVRSRIEGKSHQYLNLIECEIYRARDGLHHIALQLLLDIDPQFDNARLNAVNARLDALTTCESESEGDDDEALPVQKRRRLQNNKIN